MWVLCCRWRMWQIRQQTGVCEPLMPDVVAPEAHQYDCSYVREFSGPTFDSLHKNLAWWLVTQRTSKNHKTVKIGWWALVQRWVLAWNNTVHENHLDTLMFWLTLEPWLWAEHCKITSHWKKLSVFLSGYSLLALIHILSLTVLNTIQLDILEPLHWLILWEWTKGWKHWSKCYPMQT